MSHYLVSVSFTLDRFLLHAIGTELPPLLVCAKEPVPPDEAAGVVAVEVVVMEVVEPGTCMDMHVHVTSGTSGCCITCLLVVLAIFYHMKLCE